MRQRLLRFAAANSSLPLKDFLAEFQREQEGIELAQQREKLRVQKVLSEAGEILGVSTDEVIARITGVEAKATTGEAKKKD